MNVGEEEPADTGGDRGWSVPGPAPLADACARAAAAAAPTQGPPLLPLLLVLLPLPVMLLVRRTTRGGCRCGCRWSPATSCTLREGTGAGTAVAAEGQA